MRVLLRASARPDMGPYRAPGAGEKLVVGRLFVHRSAVHRKWNFRAFYPVIDPKEKEGRAPPDAFKPSIDRTEFAARHLPIQMGLIQQGYLL